MHQIELIDRVKLLLRWFPAIRKKIEIIDDFCFHGEINRSDTIIDVGCANYPQLGLFFAKKNYNVYLVDPTRKHKSDLLRLEKEYDNIRFVDAAIGLSDGKMSFFESDSKISGSLLQSHRNVDDLSTEYNVDVFSIDSLLIKYNISKVGLLKLDLEGAEFDLILNSSKSIWSSINQVYVEFHHHCTEYSYKDTLKCVEVLKQYGYLSFKLHRDVFLFYRNNL